MSTKNTKDTKKFRILPREAGIHSTQAWRQKPVNHTLFLLCIVLGGCVSIPDHIQAVTPFDIHRYLGRWYEIARLDHSFERGLSRVTADYSLRDDGGIKVINRGYSSDKKAWQEAEGKAYFVEGHDTGFLKVSFFGPFYGSYVIFDLDQQDYRYSLVAGPNRSYLWILSRSPVMEQGIKSQLIAKARAMGFATDQLIFPEYPDGTD